jgi:hypothetical protein
MPDKGKIHWIGDDDAGSGRFQPLLMEVLGIHAKNNGTSVGRQTFSMRMMRKQQRCHEAMCGSGRLKNDKKGQSVYL